MDVYNRDKVWNKNSNGYTPSVPNYKSFQESWRVKVFSSLTKNIERNIKIYVIKLVHYENITNKESNDTWLVPKNVIILLYKFGQT